MPEVMHQLKFSVLGNIDLEEEIRLRLAQVLPFSPDIFCFTYKQKAGNVVVDYYVNEADSIKGIDKKKRWIKNKKFYVFYGCLVGLVLINYQVLQRKSRVFSQEVQIRQLANNENFHFQKELLAIRQLRSANQFILERINTFIRQPLEINAVYIDNVSFSLDALVYKTDLDVIGEQLLEKFDIQQARIRDKGDKLWILIQGS